MPAANRLGVVVTNRIRGSRLQKIRKRHFMLNPLCVDCEREGKVKVWEELDHIVALANGGTDTDDNRVGLCREHHRIKTAKDFGNTPAPKVAIGRDGWPY